MWINKDHCRSILIDKDQFYSIKINADQFHSTNDKGRPAMIFIEPHFGSTPKIWSLLIGIGNWSSMSWYFLSHSHKIGYYKCSPIWDPLRILSCTTPEKLSFGMTPTIALHMNLFYRNKHPTVLPHTCEVCHKSFAQRYLLKRHARTHSAERQFYCDECGKAFIQPSALTTHIKVCKPVNITKCPIKKQYIFSKHY